MDKSGKGPPRLLLTLPEYDRIYKVIYSALEGRANTPRACMFFAVVSFHCPSLMDLASLTAPEAC